MKTETKSFYEQAVQRVVTLIVNGLDVALDLEALAREAALSPFHFHRVFRGMLGETPLELHRRLRLERAAWRLIHDDTPVTTLAFDAGYETHEAFTRSFRSKYGRSPSEFRRERDGGPGCAAPRMELAARSGIHFSAEGMDALALHFIVGDTKMTAEITTQPELRVAVLHHRGAYNRISEAFGKLGAIAGPAGLFKAGAQMIAVYHDDPETTAESDLRSDAGITIPAGGALPKGLSELRIPAGRYARATHKGPYEGLGDAWARLMGEWLPRSGQRIGDGVAYEVYRNTPMQVPKEELVTDMYVPLK